MFRCRVAEELFFRKGKEKKNLTDEKGLRRPFALKVGSVNLGKVIRGRGGLSTDNLQPRLPCIRKRQATCAAGRKQTRLRITKDFLLQINPYF